MPVCNRLHLLPQTKGSSSVVCAKCRESRQFSQTVMLRNELWCILFPLIICRMFLNLADWTDLGSHRLVCIRSHSCTLEHKPSHEVQGAVCRPPTQDCIEHRFGDEYRKGPSEHSGLPHPEWKKFRITRTLPRSDRRG